MRECNICRGHDLSILSEAQQNDRTLLLSRWFHCVKLPNHVFDPVHPFYGLFGDPRITKRTAPHLFVVGWEGAEPIPFDGEQLDVVFVLRRR